MLLEFKTKIFHLKTNYTKIKLFWFLIRNIFFFFYFFLLLKY
jgi:hypothetical protein